MDNRWERKKIRREVGSYGWALVIYYVMMNVSVVAFAFLGVAFQMLAKISRGEFAEVDASEMASNGWGYLAACLLAVLFIRLWKGKEFFSGIWKNEETMGGRTFFRLLCLMVSGQLLFQFCAPIQEAMLNLLGLSVMESMELAMVQTDTISMFLYMSLGAPVVEEIIFRGLILRGLERFGKGYAVLISSILFGLFHGNIIQSPYAFAVGLVLVYTAVKYNIVWAMVLHMVNNLILGDTIPRLTGWMGEIGSGLVIQIIIWICGVVSLVALFRNRKRLGAYTLPGNENWNGWWAFCTAPGVIVMFLLMQFNAWTMLLL